MDSLLASCPKDDVLPVILKHLSKGSKLLESGCGLGRFVKYLHDCGMDITGLEISELTCTAVRKKWPEVKIIQGDASNSPFRSNSFDGVISLGVVEHWVSGPGDPLKDIFRILKPRGVAIITVPCFNRIRRLKRKIFWDEFWRILRDFPRLIIRRNFAQLLMVNRFRRGFKYVVSPPIGRFFEYRMSRDEFAAEVLQAGFEIVEHIPLSHIDGIYHELNPFKMFIKFENWDFKVSSMGRYLDQALMKIPFLHCHMQAVVATKPWVRS